MQNNRSYLAAAFIQSALKYLIDYLQVNNKNDELNNKKTIIEQNFYLKLFPETKFNKNKKIDNKKPQQNVRFIDILKTDQPQRNKLFESAASEAVFPDQG